MMQSSSPRPVRSASQRSISASGPAGRAYLYYTDEHKFWTDGLTVDITPRAER